MAAQVSSTPSTIEFKLNINSSSSRIQFLKNVVPESYAPLLDQYTSHGPVIAQSTDLEVREKVSRLELANELADITGSDLALTKGLFEDADITSLRDVALKYNYEKLKELHSKSEGAKASPIGIASVKAVRKPGGSGPSSDPVTLLQNHMFNHETTAFITRMLEDGDLSTDLPKPEPKPAAKSLLQGKNIEDQSVPTAITAQNDSIKSGLITVLKNNPNFNFRQHSLSSVLSNGTSFSGIPEDSKPKVEDALKDLHLAQALTPIHQALPTLFRSKLSAFRVSQLPEQQFVDNFGASLGGDVIAKNIHQHAVRVTSRNDNALTSIIQSVRGTGIAAIDGPETPQQRRTRFKRVAADIPEQINLEKLFGSLDYCECSDCTSVTSPAAYFVELMQFLRNNNLNPNTPWSEWTNSEDFSYSPLDYLLRRRPDLACLELTCANTNTVLPYIDLANEVMESFIVHQARFIASTRRPKQSWINIFNAFDNADGLGGSSEELLAVPQNVNMLAYQILHEAVYPAAKLPYNQPVDAARQFLAFLSTSRSEITRIFQGVYHPPVLTSLDTWAEIICPCPRLSPPPPCGEESSDQDCEEDASDTSSDNERENHGSRDEGQGSDSGGEDDSECDDVFTFSSTSDRQVTTEEQATLTKIHQEAIQNAVAAEELGITQEEYIILTKQAFWPKAHFDIRHGEDVSTATYRKKIGVKKDWEYWGLDYKSLADMQDVKDGTGLTFVKKQFLPRTSILYENLVEILRTNFINPNMPKGRAKVIMESFQFSYQFLASKVDSKEKHKKARLRKLLDFIEKPTDQDAAFTEVLKDSLKKQSCCQLLFENRNPRRDYLSKEAKATDEVDSSKKHKPGKCQCGCDTELKDWICKYFEVVGKIVVLDSGEGQKLPWEADIFEYSPSAEVIRLSNITHGGSAPTAAVGEPGETLIGHIYPDGSITESTTSTNVIGYVSITGTVYISDGTLFNADRTTVVIIRRTDSPTGNTSDGSIDYKSVLLINGVDTPTPWTTTYDDCDLTKVRLQHLDGKTVTRQEYDKLHRFLRLWRKLGWSISEVDAAITAFGAGQASTQPSTPPGTTIPPYDDVDYSDFQEPCGGCCLSTCSFCSNKSQNGTMHHRRKRGKYCTRCGKLNPDKHTKKPGPKHCNCNHSSKPSSEVGTSVTTKQVSNISPYLINQIAALKKIVGLTGFSILQVLSFWTNIDTHEPSSLYSQLFLTHNMLGIDRVFAPDADGNYLVQSPPPLISEHRPVLLAGFRLKPSDLDDIIRIANITNDQLTLENVSAIYRHAKLANMLAIKPKDLETVFKVFYTPWDSAQSTLDLLKLWNRVSEAGFDLKQLGFIFKDIDDPLSPIGPTQVGVLKLATDLYTKLKAIDDQYPAITSADLATSNAVSSNTQLLFAQSAVADILSFLEGTRVYSTNAPKIDTVAIPENLKAKLKYGTTGQTTSLQTVGQLTANEIGQAKALASQNVKWSSAIDRLSKQAVAFFNTVLSPIFPDNEAAKSALLTGDVAASTSGESPDPGTAPEKRFYFLQSFIPFLKKQLSTHSIVNTMASAASLPNDVSAALLEDILVVDKNPAQNNPGKRAVSAIEAIKNDPTSQTSWSGYLLISTTDNYILSTNSVVDDNKPASISIDGQNYDFSTQQEDPTNVWYGPPIKMLGGQLYKLEVRDQLATQLMWKTDLSVPAPIPSSFLIPAHATAGVQEVLTLLIKCSFFISGFRLNLAEVKFFQEHGVDFAGLDWNSLHLDHWKRLNDYVTFKESLPKAASPLLNIFLWASNPLAKSEDVATQINLVTLWNVDEIPKFITADHFDLQSPSNFRNEVALRKIHEALEVAQKVSVDIDKLFKWAKPAIAFPDAQTIADDIKTAIRAKYTLSDWDKAIKPTYDTLRQNESNALVAYLVTQPYLVKQGIIDADSLFEFFLIDPSMCPCMETSRLKQATSSVQLFIQRCLLGLEDQESGFATGVSVDTIDRERWNWMQRYRLWEANRKVYLFPENWIQSSLRDDKSAQYKALESEMLQKDISEQSVLNAMKNYLFAIDEIANLRTISMYVEEMKNTSSSSKCDSSDKMKIVHFFARTPSSPYKYFYRTFDAIYQTWSSWSQMNVDIPSYEIERKKDGNKDETKDPLSTLNGCYIVPFMYNGRLIVGLPQFMKKQVPLPVPKQTFSDMAQGENAIQADSITALEYWEIKFGVTELLNRTWKPKVICSDAVWEAPTFPAPEVSEYQFVPEIQDPPQSSSSSDSLANTDLDTVVCINVLHNGKGVGRFSFNGSRIQRDSSDAVGQSSLTKVFQYQDGGNKHVVTSLQVSVSNPSGLEYSYRPAVEIPNSTTLGSTVYFSGFSVSEPFNHQFIHALISQAASASTLDQFFQYFQSVPDMNEAWGGPLSSQAPATDPQTYNELYRTYSLYNWEMAFHAPMALADKLLQTQQFDLALKLCHYVFNPYAKGSGVGRYWKMPPFRNIDSIDSLEKLFAKLQPNLSVSIADPINQWRDDPFQPHVLARLRPVAYMKWAVMKYIEILIAYGDWYFQQNTLEMIPMAIQCYVLASHIYGPRGQKIPKRGKKKPETYLTLLNKWDAFGNSMVQLELDFPFSNQIQKSWGESNGVRGLANIFGFATNRYFCIPNNEQLVAVRDTIDDRLFKIRHCQDIKGVFRQLPLYEPPLDIGQLVTAVAQGLSLTSILNDLNAPMPNYRFPFMLSKAVELCSELKALGGAFLSAKEKQDSESLSMLRQRHDISMANLTMEQKKLARQEAQKNIEALTHSRKRPVYQLQHVLKLLGSDTSLVPGEEQDWQELTDNIPAPVQGSGMLLSGEEMEEIDKSSDAKDVNTAVSVIQAISSELHAFPTINGHASPFGVGVAACWGPSYIAEVMNGAVQVMKIGADSLSFQSSAAGRKNSHLRTRQDRVHTANTQGYEIKNIDQQILTQQLRISIADQEITNQQQQIDNTQEVMGFLTNKYTNNELYSFMEGRVRSLYYQTYQMAYNWARKAEMCFRFERGIKDTNYIQPGYWEPGHDGLLSGESLFMSLKNMEAAYHEYRGYDFEVSKFVSLRQINPLALMNLRESGNCEFAIPEILFDMDFPGQYLRKIKSVALTIPCVVGPYSTVNCTLRLTAHKYRSDPTAKDKKDYVEKTQDSSQDPRFDTANIPISAVAVSSGNNDSGVFELNFKDERFMPFEGAGCASQWSLELPSNFRQFDYGSITDTILHLRYTSRDGGAKLRDIAAGAVDDYIRTVSDLSSQDGLFAILDARADFAVEWQAFMHPASSATQRVLGLKGVNERLPLYTKGHPVAGLLAQDVWIVTDAQINSAALTLVQGSNELAFTDAKAVGGLKTFVASGPCVISDWDVVVGDVRVGITRMWILVRYVMK